MPAGRGASWATLPTVFMTPTEGAHGRVGTLAVISSMAVMVLASIYASAASAGTASQVPFTARGSVEQVDVTGAHPGASYSLIDSNGDVADTREAGSLGGIVFRHVDPAGGYRVRQGGREAAVPVLQGALEPPRRRPARASTTRRCPRAATAT